MAYAAKQVIKRLRGKRHGLLRKAPAPLRQRVAPFAFPQRPELATLAQRATSGFKQTGLIRNFMGREIFYAR